MSKEKLQEIRRTYSIDGKEYIDEFIFIKKDIDELMKLAYNQALEDAEENASITYVLDNEGVYNLPVVDKQSIKKLKIK